MDKKYRYLLINQEGSLLDHYTKNKKKRTHTKSEPGQARMWKLKAILSQSLKLQLLNPTQCQFFVSENSEFKVVGG